jgi:hypothetical protein
MTAIALSIELVNAAFCIRCGVPIVMPRVRETELRRSHENFFCVNGHPQHWPAQSDLEKAHAELELEKKRHEWTKQSLKTAEHTRSVVQGKLSAMKERVANGVCPCCRRNFVNLQRHMLSKHPHFREEE